MVALLLPRRCFLHQQQGPKAKAAWVACALGTHMPEHQHIPVTRIKNIDFEIRADEAMVESREHWNNRADAVANLLLALWKEEHEELQREQLATIAARN